MIDNINPVHYKKLGVETIEVIRGSMSEEQYEGFLKGNILKYLARYKNKNGIEDLRKAEWYLKKLISYEEEER